MFRLPFVGISAGGRQDSVQRHVRVCRWWDGAGGKRDRLVGQHPTHSTYGLIQPEVGVDPERPGSTAKTGIAAIATTFRHQALLQAGHRDPDRRNVTATQPNKHFRGDRKPNTSNASAHPNNNSATTTPASGPTLTPIDRSPPLVAARTRRPGAPRIMPAALEGRARNLWGSSPSR